MNELERRTLLGAVGIGALAALAKAGPLNPPAGGITSTAKPLGEVEPRTAINSANTPGDAESAFIISQPGSYYLAANITIGANIPFGGGNGITITADNVTLDLNGFSISSSASLASGSGVAISGLRTNIAVRNGHIRGGTTFIAGAFVPVGFNHGISAAAGCANIRVSDVGVAAVAGDGIGLGAVTDISNVVERCTARICVYGIRASVIADCAAGTTGDTAISGDVVTRCRGETVSTTANAYGIEADSIAENCRGKSSIYTGVQAAIARGCHGVSGEGSGLFASYSADNCSGSSTSGVGLATTLATNCFSQSASGNGLNASTASNCLSLSNTAVGMNVQGTATNCRAQRPGGTAIMAGIAIGCTTIAGTITSANKFLGTP